MRRIPVPVEALAHLLRHPPEGEQVQVGETHPRTGSEVRIADVAPADDRQAPVCNPGLVVHAPMQSRELANPREPALPSATHRRIEQPYFQPGQGIEHCKHGIERGHAVVIDEQADTNATLGCAPRLFEQQPPRRIVVPEVDLHVERALRAARGMTRSGAGARRGQFSSFCLLQTIATSLRVCAITYQLLMSVKRD